MKKEITIKIDKKFIEESVYQEEWGDVKLDSKELSENISKYIKESTESITRKVIKEVIVEIVKKDLKKQVKEKVKGFIIGMSDSELFYNDEFRIFLVDIAKDNRKDIDTKLKVFLNNDNKMFEKISQGIGDQLADKFIEAMKNGRIE